MSIDRDRSINNNPIYFYEQLMRQQTVFELLNPSKGEKILDAGAGNFRDSLPLVRQGMNIFATDISTGMLREGIKSITGNLKPHYAQCSVLNLPYPDKSF